VVVEGRVLMRDRRFLHLDEKRVMENANDAAARSMRAAGISA
jgi:hypothetical protein